MEIDQKQLNLILEDYTSGRLKVREIFEKYKIPATNFYRLIKNVEKRRTVERFKEIIELLPFYHSQGLINKDIAKKLNVSIDFVLDNLKKLGLNAKNRRTLMDSYIFDNYLNPNVQYWLGVLATDGSISENRIILGQGTTNKELVYKFRDFLGISTEVNLVTYSKFGKSFTDYKIQFRSDYVKNLLDSYGITKNKSLTLNMNIPITFDFLRGALDGDGSIQTDRQTVRLASASEKFINQVSELLSKFNINHKIYKKKNKNISYDLQVDQTG